MWTIRQPRASIPALAPCLALCLAAAAVSAAHAEDPASPPAGLVELPRPFIPAQGILQVGAASEEIVAPGRWRLGATWTLANNWAHSRAVDPVLSARQEREPVTLEELRAIEPLGRSRGLFYVDGAIYRLELTARRGVAEGVEVGVSLPVLRTDGGFVDATVEGFHDLINQDDNRSDRVPRGEYTVYLRPADQREWFSDSPPGTAVGDLRLELRTRLPAAAGWGLALRGLLELPTGDEARLFGSGDLDLGLQLLAGHRLGRGRIHLGAATVWSGGLDTLGVPSQLLLSGHLAYRRPIGPRSSWFAQLVVAEAPLQHLGMAELERESYILDLGWQHRLGAGPTLVVAASENNFTFQSSMDFGLHLGLFQSF